VFVPRQDLVDVELFASAQAAIDGLQRRDCALALAWCASHRQRLHKLRSTLEFNLRLQEFVEMVRGGRCREAIAYARKHLAPMAAKEPCHMPTVQQAMGALAFPAAVCKPLPYRELFDDERWAELIYELRRENHRLYALPPHSLLAIAAQAGLSSLKTQFCYGAEEGRSRECPVCVEDIGKLAGPLPSSLRTKSCVRCQLTAQQFDNDDYAPFALPNGRVYSRKVRVSCVSCVVRRVVR
jgi:macrophage erythroblast attacher